MDDQAENLISLKEFVDPFTDESVIKVKKNHCKCLPEKVARLKHLLSKDL